MTNLNNKIKGMFLGIGVGDALGMPVETFTNEEINRKYPNFLRDTDYKRPDGHKWFDGFEAGSTTDDTQLSLAVADALIAARRYDLKAIVDEHIKAYHQKTGWGATTTKAIEKIIETGEIKPFEVENEAKLGLGNGCAMKIAPLALYHYLQYKKMVLPLKEDVRVSLHDYLKALRLRIKEFCSFTHDTDIAEVVATIQHGAVCFALDSDSYENFRNRFLRFLFYVLGTSSDEKFLNQVLYAISDNAHNLRYKIRGKGKERFDCYHSYPTMLSYLVQDYALTFDDKKSMDVSTIYSLIVFEGGDTDTNASMLCSVLGSLYGDAYFPSYLQDGLLDKERILERAEAFANLWSPE